MEWVYVWLGVLAVSLIVEFISMELVSIWVSVGSLVAMILAFCKVSITIQLVVFGVVTIACILGLRRIAMKFFFRNKGKTNLDAIVGTVHKLLKKVDDDELGSIKINGVEWSVKSVNDETIEAGNYVEIVSVDGNKFIVKKATDKKIEQQQVSEKDNNLDKKNNETQTDKENISTDTEETKSSDKNKKTQSKPKTSKK